MFISGYEFLSCNFLKWKWIHLCRQTEKTWQIVKWGRCLFLGASMCFPLVTSSLPQQLEMHLNLKLCSALLHQACRSKTTTIEDKLKSLSTSLNSPVPHLQLTLLYTLKPRGTNRSVRHIFPDCSAQQSTYRGFSIGGGSCKTSSVQNIELSLDFSEATVSWCLTLSLVIK